MTDNDRRRLQSRIRKLEALASDRNPNAAERDSAAAKAKELKNKLPALRRKQERDPISERAAQSARDATARQRVNVQQQAVEYLRDNLTRLKPGDQLLAAEYCMTYHTYGLTDKQWNVVQMYVGELKG